MAGALDDDGVAFTYARDVDPVDGAREAFEKGELCGGEVVGQLVEPGAGEQAHVLAVAAPQTVLVFEAERVRVAGDDPGRVRGARRLHHHDLDGYAVADFDAEIGVRSEGVDTAHDLVAGHDRRDLAGHVVVAVQLGHVAAAHTDRLDPEDGSARARARDRETADRVGAIALEDGGATVGHRGFPLLVFEHRS